MLKTLPLLLFQLKIQNYVSGFTKHVMPLDARVRNHWGNAMSEKSIELEYLEGSTLLSVQQCLDAYGAMKRVESVGDKPNVVFLDASWWHKGDVDGRKMFENGPRIPGSIYFAVDDVALTHDLNSDSLPNMLPTSNFFAAVMDECGVRNQDHVIITARESVYFTPRIWFLFKTFGHDPNKVHLMQGSLEDWIKLGGEVDKNSTVAPKFQDMGLGQKEAYSYKVRAPTGVCNMKEVLEAITVNVDKSKTEKVLILDSRGSSFAKNGHMPGAIHLPYSNWVLPENNLKWKSVNELKSVFENAGVDPMTNNKIICSCGTGVSVCHTLLALELCGRDLLQSNTKMYDGSWSEWRQKSGTPKAP